MNEEIPHAPKAEAGVIGSILLDPTALHKCRLEPKSFYDRRNQIAFEQLLKMSQSNIPMDAINIGQWMKDKGVLEAVGGYDRLVELQEATLVPDHIESYAMTVKEKSDYRCLIDSGRMMVDQAMRGSAEPDEIRGEMLGKLIGSVKPQSIDDNTIIQNWRDAASGVIQTIPTPFQRLNRCMGGIRVGMNTILTGRTSSGKSMLLSWWYQYLGMQDIPTLIFPFEDQYEVTKTRMAACLGSYSWGRLQNGGSWKEYDGQKEWVKTTEREIQKGIDNLERINKMPVYFECDRSSVKEVRLKVREAKARYGIKAVFYDGFKDFKRPSGGYADVGSDEELSQELADIAASESIASVTVNHLTKIPEGERITLNNIRGSGNIVSDSRAVLAWQNQGLADYPVYGDDTGVIEILKSNHSKLGWIEVGKDMEKCQFWECQ